MAQSQLRPIITARPEHGPSPHASFTQTLLCLSPCFEDPEPSLTFAKVAITTAPSAPSSVFAGTSTDSEAQSTNEGYCSPTHPRLPRSPSLLSSMFASQPGSGMSSAAVSRNGSTSGTCSANLATPLSPLSPVSSNPHTLPSHIALACASTAQDCKPILRRHDPAPCASTSTSASEDNGASRGYRSASTNGLGLALSGTESVAVAQEKRCALKFAVKPCFPEGSFNRSARAGCYDSIRSGAGPSRRQRSRSPDPIPEWEEVCTPGLESSDDEGYEEDEEGGFTSDEDELGALAAQAGTRQRFAWTSSARHAYLPGRAASAIGLATPRRRTAVETYCTTDDNAPEPMRGREISIAAKSTDKCSRHLSPPPRSPSPEYAPPAARSPSARDLCMRRARVMSERAEDSCLSEAKGWKSDGAFFGSAYGHASVARSQTAPPAPALEGADGMNLPVCEGDQVQWQVRKASLPNPSSSSIACKSILRCAEFVPPAPIFVQSATGRVASPRMGVTPLSSAPSSPRSARRLPAPLSPISTSIGMEDQSHASASRAMCGDARSGLELALNGRKASVS